MFENYIYTLASRSGVVSDWIRVFFAGICKFVYSFIASMYDTIKVIADREYLGLGNYAEDMASKIFFALVIFMIFKLTITFLSYLVSPDTFSDSNKGVQNVIKRVIISIVLLVSINPLFNVLYNVQDELLNDDAISSIVLGSSSDAIYQSSEGATYYFTKISDICDNNKKAVTSSTGEHFALLTLRPFIQPSDYVIDDDGTVVSEGLMSSDSYYCGQEIDTSKDEIYIENYNLNTEYYLSSDVITDTAKEENSLSMVDYYRIDFNFFFALVVGIVVFLLLLNLSFDVVVRAFTLLILQVVAPIPIINYVTPGNKGSEMLSSWGKKLFSTWASLFIRLLSITLAVSFVGAICENGTISSKGGLVIQIIVIIGALIFAKQLPKLLEELFPGMKLGGGGFNLNPFKRVREDALGGNLALGAAAGVGAAGLSGLTNFGQRAGETFQNVRNAEGWRNRLRALGAGTARTFGSTVAGATRGGVNAFNRTRKDGHMFGGLWNGYQTSMYSKLKREEFHRQGGTLGGTVRADLNRWTGTLTEGQRESILAEQQDQYIEKLQENLNRDKRNLAQRKHDSLEPYEQYASYAQKIKERISNSKAVKDAKKALEDAQAIGDETQIRNARQVLDAAEAQTGRDLMANDREVQHYLQRMNNLRTQNTALQAQQFDYKKADGTFNSGSIFNTQHEANIIADRFTREESQFTVREREIETYKSSDEYKRAHSKMSEAKVSNSQKFNNEPQAAGTTFAAGQSIYGGVIEGASMPGYLDTNGDGRLGGGRGGRPGGGPMPPPPPGGNS